MGRKATFYLIDKILLLATLLFFVAACLCRHGASVDPAADPRWLLFALAAPAAAAANLAAAIGWLVCRRPLRALVPAAALAVAWPSIAATVQLRIPRDEAAQELRIATYNVHGFRGENGFRSVVTRVAALLEEQRTDVVCLQEFRTTSDYDTAEVVRLLGLPYAVCDRSVVLLSRYPIVRHQSIRFEQEKADANNGTLEADVATPAGPLRIVACHLRTTGVSSLEHRYARDYGMRFVPLRELSQELTRNAQRRAVQARRIAQRAKESPCPVVVAGDFNDTPTTYTYHVMAQTLGDTFRQGGSGWGGTYRRAGGLLRLDYIFVSDGIRCGRCHTVDTGLSDHKPVIAALRFDDGR